MGVGKGCDLSVIGEKSTKAYLAFDHDFREAVESQDAGRIALLTEFPLTVNNAGGAIQIPDADSLQGHYARIFTPAIRHIILSSTRDSIRCNYTGVSYDEVGNVWVNVTNQGYFLETINLPDISSISTTKGSTVDMACHTNDRRILIDSTPKGIPRFRSWSFGHALFGPPGLEIATGKEDWEGTGQCAHRLWSFHDSKAQITLESAKGCYSDTDAPPPSAQAQFVLTDTHGKELSSTWCF
ncbi:MAG TPA: hypothetical protein VME18_01020 [Acidobacteriaceae bacterium]|nr:hypothetical protein [Acidobacteriaceae bacterium]